MVGARQRGPTRVCRREPAKPGQDGAPGERHCSATLSSQERIDQIASWLKISPKAGM